MRHRALFTIVASIVFPGYLSLAPSVAAQVTVQQPVKKLVQTMKLEVKDEQAVIASAGGNKVIVLDLKGDDLDLGGRASIDVGGSIRELGWTFSNTDDAFLMVSAASIRQLGYELTWPDGGRVQGQVMVSNGLQLIVNGKILNIRDPSELLRQFDTNGNGQVDQTDTTWRYLYLFVDKNGDGKIAPAELSSWTDSGVRAIGVSTERARKDSFGNKVGNGVFMIGDGLRKAGFVTLRKY
jgi:hypothetical protein